jgi:hypothetical protein
MRLGPMANRRRVEWSASDSRVADRREHDRTFDLSSSKATRTSTMATQIGGDARPGGYEGRSRRGSRHGMPWPACWCRHRGRRSYGPAELPSHHRTVGPAPEDDLKAVHGEGRRDPGKQVAGMTCHCGVHRVGLQRGRARRSTGSTTPAGHRSAAGTGRASATPARRAGPARTIRRPARRRRQADPAAARMRRAGRGLACCPPAAGHGSAGQCASTCTSSRLRRPPGQTARQARASARLSAG